MPDAVNTGRAAALASTSSNLISTWQSKNYLSAKAIVWNYSPVSGTNLLTTFCASVSKFLPEYRDNDFPEPKFLGSERPESGAQQCQKAAST